MFDRSERRRRSDPYLYDYTKNEKGEYVYTGAYMEYPEESFKGMCVRYSIAAVLELVLFCVPGLVSAVSTHHWMVMVPYAILLVPLVFVPISVVRIVFSKGVFVKRSYDIAVERLRIYAIVGVIGGALMTVGAIIFISLFGFGEVMDGDYAVLAVAALLCLTNLWIVLQLKKDVWELKEE